MLLSAKIAAIEFAGDEVRVALVKTNGRRANVLELSACRAEYATPEERFDALVLAADIALDQLKQRPAVYVLCTSSRYGIVRTITIPFRGKRRVAAAVQFELEPYLAFPIEELLVDFNVVAEVDGETEVLAMGMRRQQLEEQVAVLSAAGVEVEAVNLDAVAMTGLWHSRQKKLKGLTAVLHVRNDSACLAVLYNSTLAYFRRLDMPAGQPGAAPAAVAREVQNSIRAFLANWRAEGEIAELYVTGLDFEPGVREEFETALRLPVHETLVLESLKGGARALARAVYTTTTGTQPPAASDAPAATETPLEQARALAAEVGETPEAEAEATPDFSPDDGETAAPEIAAEDMGPLQPAMTAEHNYWEAAIGTALAGAGGAFSLDFKRAERDWQSALRGVVTHLMFSSCLALLVLLGWAFYYHQGTARNEREAVAVQQEIDALQEEIMAMAEQGLGSDVDVTPYKDPTLLDLMRELSRVMPGDKVHISRIRIMPPEARGPWIRIEGTVENSEVFYQAFEQLKASPLMQVDEQHDLRQQGELITFSVRAFRPEEEPDEAAT